MIIVGDSSKARILASGIDQGFAICLMLFMVALVPEQYPILKAGCFFGIYLLYFIILEAIWSRTIGKYYYGLVTRKVDGNLCDWKASIIRNGLRLFEVNPLFFGALPAGIAIISSKQKQRIGDMLAGTVVVSNKMIWDANSLTSTPENDSN